jgi:hypothetical protein
MGSTGRYSIDTRSLIKPSAIDSAWMYGDVTYSNPRMLYHKALVNESITGYAGGDRTHPSAESLEALREYISERPISVSGTAEAGNVRTVSHRDDSVLSNDTEEKNRLRVLVLAANVFTTAETNRWMVDTIVRCPCCFHAIPAGLTQCFVCSTSFNIKGSVKTSLVAAAVPMDNVLSMAASGAKLETGGKTSRM